MDNQESDIFEKLKTVIDDHSSYLKAKLENDIETLLLYRFEDDSYDESGEICNPVETAVSIGGLFNELV